MRARRHGTSFVMTTSMEGGQVASRSRPSKQRVPELDGLRGLAILLVVVSHAFILPAVMGGVVGVTLFFVLSGYLITRLLLIERDEHGSISLSYFYGRRALRLFPALAVYLLVLAVLLSVSGLEAPIWDITWPPALYSSNYAQILGHDVFPHRQTWSLAVEEHFYLIWPVLVGLGATTRIRALGVVVVLLLAWRVAMANFDLLWAYQGTDTNAYALGAGCLLASARHQGVAPRLPRVTPLAGMGFFASASFLPVAGITGFLQMAVWLAPTVALVAMLTISSVLDHRTPFLRGRVLGWLGLVSYGLYLWHAPLMVLPPLSLSVGGRVLGLAMAVGLAAISWHFVERPILHSRLRRRFQRSQLSEVGAGTEIVIDLQALHTEDAVVGIGRLATQRSSA